MGLEHMGMLIAVVIVAACVALAACGNGSVARSTATQFVAGCDDKSIKVAISDDGKHKTMLISCARID